MRSRRKRTRKLRWGDLWAKLKAAAGVILGVAAILAVVALVVVLEMDVPGSEIQVTGTVTGLYQAQSQYHPSPTRFLVRLDNDEVVVVAGTESLVFRKGKRVIVFEQTTRILGRKAYQFGGYLEEERSDLK